MTEEQLQVKILLWWDRICDQYDAVPSELMHIPNGLVSTGLTNKVKALGVRPGYPDLMLAIPNKSYHALFIELKRPDRDIMTAVSPQQRKIINRLKSHSYCCVVCNRLEDAQATIVAYLEDLL